MILLLDNFDSFAHNLARYLRQLGAETVVIRNDAITAAQVVEMAPRAVVLSPGPCSPNEAGHSLEIVRHCAGRIPILGICLGHQTIVQALGGRIINAARPCHGRASPIFHDDRALFAGLPNPLRGGRYHSLIADRATIPQPLRVSAWLDDGTVMAVSDPDDRLVGLQFHPESILTEYGYELLFRFLLRHQVMAAAESSPKSAVGQRPHLAVPESFQNILERVAT